MADPYVSEVKYLGGANVDFIEISVDAGTDVSNIVVTVYHPSGLVRSTNTLEYYASTEFGKDVYLINKNLSSTFNGLNRLGGVSLSESGTVYQFISFDDGAPVTASAGAADGLTSDQIGQTGANESLQSTDDGATYVAVFPPTPGTIPCFVTGTLIETPGGSVKVENLKPGALVIDAQGGSLRVLALLTRRVSVAQTTCHPTLRPVCIKAGALGSGLPKRELFVSRQHRVAVTSPVVERMFGCATSLVSAVRLLDMPGIDLVKTPRKITYCHLLLERHGIVLAEGAPCESFLIAPASIQAVSDVAGKQIKSLFPESKEQGYVAPSCAHIPQNKQQKRLVWRHCKNKKPLVCEALVAA